MKCPECGSETTDDIVLIPLAGMQQLLQVTFRFCPACRWVIVPDWAWTKFELRDKAAQEATR